jgi:orotidine-5'-phosphate decarboxylase
MARDAGFDGVVASAREARAIREAIGPDFLIVTPGIRPQGASPDDQKRVVTPADAIAAGADYLVIGRPITAAPDPRAAANTIIGEIEAALPGQG